MMSLFLVPVDEPSYRRTLAEPIDLSDWEDRPPDVPASARVWGVRTDPEQGSWERNRRNWEIMEPGDPLVFYRNRHGRYDAAGRVDSKIETEYIRDRYWGGGPAVTVYTVEDYDESVRLSREQVNETLCYKADFHPQGLLRVSDDRPTARLARRVGL